MHQNGPFPVTSVPPKSVKPAPGANQLLFRTLAALAVALGTISYSGWAEAHSSETVGAVSGNPVQVTSKGFLQAYSADAQLKFKTSTQFYSQGDPTPEEQLMLELVNRARLNPPAEAARFGIDLNEGITNNPISPTPKQPLAFNPHIIQAARGHSLWMLTNSIFAHVETNGSDPGDRMTAAGYDFTPAYAYGENIAWRGTTAKTIPVGPTVVQEHQDLFVDDGIEDRGHRRNLMDEAFREVGIGAEPGTFTQDAVDYSSVMVTQDFAASASNPGPFLLGVIYKDSDANQFYSVGEGLAGVVVTPNAGSFQAISSTSGGYAIPISGLQGTLQVTFSGGALSTPITKSIVLTGENVKLDFEFNADTAPKLVFVPGSAQFGGSRHFQADVSGPANARVSIQTSTDLNTWSEVSQLTLTGGKAHFTDSLAAQPHRYYRAVKL